MRVLLIANAKSGTSTDATKIADLLRAAGAEPRQIDIDEVEGADPGDAERIVVAGGDGSIGLAARLAANHGLSLGVIPTGTANDFARAMDIPLDLDDAARLAADPDATTRQVDIACTGDRPFVNAASAGLSTSAAEEAKPLKPRLGSLAYAVGAIKAAATAEGLQARVEVDGEQVFDDRAWQVVVANTGHFGGGSSTGSTDDDDRLLDVAIVPRDSRAKLAKRAWGMKRGSLAEQDDVVHARGRTVTVRGPSTFNVDGEVCHIDAPFTIGDRVEVVVG